VVVKTLFPEMMNDMKVVMRFVQEARTIMSFEHENLVRGYDVQQGQSLSYFVMEFLDGQSVEDILEDRAFFDQKEATEIVFGIAKALQYLEKHHLVHRDVKPANIIVNTDGTAKLVDFGIVKMTDRTCSLTTEGIILGTPYYLSPEQINNSKVDIRSDIYCLGATYYHMVVGEVPFPGDNPLDVIQQRLEKSPKPGKVKPDLDKNICNLLEKMMNKNIKKRHNTTKELVEELEMVLKKLRG
jgi:serine/threonine-protein kinase